MATTKKSTFETLYAVNVKDKIEKKGSLDYLSWASAWAEVKKIYPNITYRVYENEAYPGLNYFHDGRTAWVKVGVTINDLEHINHLPVMDYRNKSIGVDKLTSMDVNTAIQRCLTKAIALHGLGLAVYNGEDIQENAVVVNEVAKPQAKANAKLSVPADKWSKMKSYAKANKANSKLVLEAIKSQNITLTDFMKNELTKILS
jgi:hypothetical protein